MKITNWKMTFDLKTLSMLLLIVPFLDVGLAHSSLVNKKCGDTTCKIYEYCSDQDFNCRPCEHICDAGTLNAQNYNEARCQEQCADFVHDIQIGYARKSDIQALLNEVNKVYALLVVVLILLVMLITAVGGVLAKRFYKYWKRVSTRKLEQKKFQQKMSTVQYTISNNNPKREDSFNGTMRQSMRTNMPSTTTLTTQTEESPPCTNKSTSTTKTLPLSIEEPCEDTTLDYAAYVNQALSHSPPSEIHLCPTKLDMA